MSDRIFGAGLKRVQHFDFMHQLGEPIRRWLAWSAQAVAGGESAGSWIILHRDPKTRLPAIK